VDPEMIANDAWADFQHINPKLAKKWAGPEHWRFTSKCKFCVSDPFLLT
jgi:hypothetical protein